MKELNIKPDELYKYAGRSWLEIDIDQLGINIEAIKTHFKEGVNFYVVIKANAYGYGAVEIAHEMRNHGAKGFAVATLDEAIELRQHGIYEPILLLSYNELERAELASNYDFEITIPDMDFATELNSSYNKIGKIAKIHIAIDTGMGRIGFNSEDEDVVEQIISLNKMSNIEIGGIYTHFSTASGSDYSDGNDSEINARKYFYEQLEKFKLLINKLEAEGINIPIIHAANSASIISYPESQFDAVRVGIITYGIYPSKSLYISRKDKDIQPAVAWKTRVHQVKYIKAGGSVGYDRRFVADKDMKIATLPVGYADGYSRSMIEKAQVLYNGNRCNVLGSVCMDMLMIDCSNLNFEPKRGDVVDLIDPHVGFEYIDVYDQAKWRETIPYEIGTSINFRIPRVYKKSGEYYKIVWY